MRLLHTADLHIGQNFYGYDRTEEQQAMLDQIVAYAEANDVDAVVVSGDVFDVTRPSAEAVRMFARAMSELRRRCPEAAVVVTAGNHDSGRLLESHSPIYGTLDISLLGHIDPADARTHLVRVRGGGVIVAVPFVYTRAIPEGFVQGLIDAAREIAGEAPVVLMAHTTVAGSDATGHTVAEGRHDVGNIEAVDMAALGTGYDYLALGHIHRSQFVGGDRRVRYSGTPLAVSFDEQYPHTVSLVEIAGRGAIPTVTELPVGNPLPLTTLPADGYGRWEEVMALVGAFPADERVYLRLNVEVDGMLPPDARERVYDACADKACCFCLINAKRREQAAAEKRAALTVSEFRSMPPIEIARLHAAETGYELDEELLAQVIQMLEGDSQSS